MSKSKKKHKDYMEILPKVTLRINLQLVIQETNHTDSKNPKRMNYILLSFIRFAYGNKVFLKT